MEVDFGFYPLRVDVDLGDIRIMTRDDFQASVEAVRREPFIEGEWIYSPPKRVHVFGTNAIKTLPYPSRVFGLPKTHTLRHRMDDPIRISFLVWCFGFLAGMRLTDQDAGLLDATPITPGVTNDIVWSGDSLMLALTIADDFFATHAATPKIELTLRAAMHSYMTSATPTLLDYERFIHLYTAIDACHAGYELITAGKKRVRHAERIAYLCEQLSLPTPSWADRGSVLVASRRNETFHEGLFFGEPWGLSICGGDQHDDPKHRMLLLEMEKLTCRIAIALLGIQDREYLESPVDDRQRHRIRLNRGPKPG